ncbi:hydroxyisourate hydrolase [Adhaeribacter aquaticus]|uniref:hydroxyisourate hydrolase n=1 Tax=Adhaeribacter aquaticus TaxID=299567 RepID=UPI000412B297|nr:hydroxyisourate hydrolase [Adhaeribacter aquaticus]
MSQITTHILDTTKGKPAPGVTIILAKQANTAWIELTRGVTNLDGRIPDLLNKETTLDLGIYKMTFLTKEYFDQEAIATFYPLVEIIFEVNSTEHYHIPLLLNPFGYSTYRGS